MFPVKILIVRPINVSLQVSSKLLAAEFVVFIQTRAAIATVFGARVGGIHECARGHRGRFERLKFRPLRV